MAASKDLLLPEWMDQPILLVRTHLSLCLWYIVLRLLVEPGIVARVTEEL